MSKRVILTGGTGLIGKEALAYLINKGFEIYSITTKETESSEINWVKCDLFDTQALGKIFEEIKPQYLLNFAWITGGDYLTNEKNLLYKDTGIKMLEYFKQNGGKRAVYAGTCFEYDITGEILTETSRLNPKTLYAKCKKELFEEGMKYSQNNSISFGWGRIFYVFGQGEKPSRLTAKILNSLSNKEHMEIGAPFNNLDYMYTKDIARAFVELLDSDYSGAVNICTGKGILLKDYALLMQKVFGEKDIITFNPNPAPATVCIGNNALLKKLTGFAPRYTIEEGIKEVVEAYKRTL